MDALITQWKQDFKKHIGNLAGRGSSVSDELFTEEKINALEKLWLEINTEKVNPTH